MDISTIQGSMAGQWSSAPSPRAGGAGGPSFEEVLQNTDADSDSSLSIDEIGISEEAFALADLNSDGLIDASEFESGGNRIIGDDLKAQGPPPGEMQPGMGAMTAGSSSYFDMMDIISGDVYGQDGSMYSQYGVGLGSGLDLVA